MKRTRPVLVLASLAIAVAACGPSSGVLGSLPPASPGSSIDTGPDLTPGPTAGTPSPSAPPPSGAPTSEPGTSPTPSAAPAETMIIRAYFVLGGEPGTSGLVAVLRTVPKTTATATAAIDALLAGPTSTESGDRAVTSAVPSGSKLLGLTIKNGVATIDLSSEFESGGGSASTLNRLGQVVYTLTQFSTVRSVVFQIDGRTVNVFGSEGVVLDGPVGRADYVELLPAIFVDRPAYRAAIGNPAHVTGSAQNVFEATFRITLLDGAGKTIADQQAMAACMCASGKFDVTVAYDVPKAQWGTLRVWDGSARDGSPENVREYPVWLTPVG